MYLENWILHLDVAPHSFPTLAHRMHTPHKTPASLTKTDSYTHSHILNQLLLGHFQHYLFFIQHVHSSRDEGFSKALKEISAFVLDEVNCVFNMSLHT